MDVRELSNVKEGHEMVMAKTVEANREELVQAARLLGAASQAESYRDFIFRLAGSFGDAFEECVFAPGGCHKPVQCKRPMGSPP